MLMFLKENKVLQGLNRVLSRYEVSCNTEAIGLREARVTMTRGWP
jgi:hypothetical protein